MRNVLMFLRAALLVGAWSAQPAQAQGTSDPDIRNIRPVVMLLVDTSGSMERLPGGSGAGLPQCSGSPGGVNDHNRWSIMVEALTGTWDPASFFCTSVSRSGFASTLPDYNYYIPWHEPPLLVPQNNDGILDTYAARVKFGLMTFDSTYTFTDSHPLLVPQTTFESRLIANVGAVGGYSYGTRRPLIYQGCPTTFMVDSGARHGTAPQGALVSVGPEGPNPATINAIIQDQIRYARPHGGTPTAAMLDDFEYYLNNNSDVTAIGDPFATCRPRYALLLTDGQPDEDFRDSRFNCEVGGTCPYRRSSQIADALCNYSSTSGECTGILDGLFVVALDVNDTAALAELDNIADLGGTTAALRADDLATLQAAIADALDRAAPGNTSRSTPAFVTGSSATVGGNSVQYQFNAGFTVGDDTTPWSGVLERTRFTCDDSTLVPTADDPATRLRFDQVLNGNDTRRLLTVVTSNVTDMDENLIGATADSFPFSATVPSGAVTSLSLTTFNSAIDPAYFGFSGPTAPARRDYVVDWVHGQTADRTANRMGDIYHSSPVAIGPPRLDIADESYNAFRALPGVADRPTTVYVGTNDGVLHAFSVEDWSNDAATKSYSEGEEMWGFVPPILLARLNSATVSHQILLDGTPVVRDVFFSRQPGDVAIGTNYHTVLVMGFRGGAVGYFALDITDPTDPIFLWQHVGESLPGLGGLPTELGYASGTPAIGQILMDVGVLQERAVAVLPGGEGEIDTAAALAAGVNGCAPTGAGPADVSVNTTSSRSRQRCWGNRGRILTYLDIATGQIIRRDVETTFNAPLNGSISLYPGDVGTIAQRAFMTDADGVIWSTDFHELNPVDWDVRALHDMFWDSPALEGQPAFPPPILSTDTQGQIVVMQASGDIDRLDSTAPNRVVSLTETVTFLAGGVPSYSTELNWEIRLRDGEQVTGALELFEGRGYFASFESGVSAGDACNIGQSRIWAVDYLERGATPPPGYNDVIGGRFPEAGFETTPGTGVYDAHFRGPIADRLVLGVGITQRPTCVRGGDVFDPYIGNRYVVNETGGGAFTLTAMMSGGTVDASGGAAIQTVTETLAAPATTTTVSAFAGQVDY